MESTQPPIIPNGQVPWRRATVRHHLWDSLGVQVVTINGEQYILKFPAVGDNRNVDTRMAIPTWIDANPWQPVHSLDFKVTSAPTVNEAPASYDWGAAALGWAGGTLVLALFLLLVRAVEKCLDKKLFKSGPGQLGQAQTPGVLTTRRPRPNDDDAEHGAVGQDEFPSDVDLPPSYCDCAGEVNIVSGDTKPPATREQDLPSYSDCYVPVNHKSGLAPIYVYCTRGTRTNRSANAKVVEVNETAPDVVTQPEQSNEAPDTVAHSGEVDTTNGDIKDDAETKKPDGNVTV